MKAFLNRRYRFSASHRLHADSLSVEENHETFGKCNNPHGHGHNYVVTVRLSGEVDPATGMVANLADLDRFAAENLLSRFDRVNLNTIEPFENIVPTTENLAIEVHRIFSAFPFASLESINIEETGNNSFQYVTPERLH